MLKMTRWAVCFNSPCCSKRVVSFVSIVSSMFSVCVFAGPTSRPLRRILWPKMAIPWTSRPMEAHQRIALATVLWIPLHWWFDLYEGNFQTSCWDESVDEFLNPVLGERSNWGEICDLGVSLRRAAAWWPVDGCRIIASFAFSIHALLSHSLYFILTPIYATIIICSMN